MLNADKLLPIRLRAVDLDDLTRFPRCQDVVIGIQSIQEMQDILTHLRRYLPHIRSCRLEGMYIDEESQLFGLRSMLLEGLVDFKQLESFGLRANCNPSLTISKDSSLDSWLKSYPTLQACLLDWVRAFFMGTTYRSQVVLGKAQSTTQLCRMEIIFPFCHL
ncbi:hypothetical protein C8J56DRAFT_1167201 [Mycena floridula]|nr:hypothetical protein C8J56DRAFT_1167201 [Mycena floridula]